VAEGPRLERVLADKHAREKKQARIGVSCLSERVQAEPPSPAGPLPT
jgi:hypothetical protein